MHKFIRIIITVTTLYFNYADGSCYIDYENGDDANPGTKEKPWKHHPWDPQVHDENLKFFDANKFIFKKGVIYRGTIDVKKSGETNNPIIFSTDPFWGEGRASIYGSKRITTGWEKCNAEDCKEIPASSVENLWYQDVVLDAIPIMIYEIRKEGIIKIDMARSPNWQVTDLNNPRKEWWEFSGATYVAVISLDHTEGFSIGDKVTGTGIWADREEDRLNIGQGSNKILEVGNGLIKVAIEKMKNGEFNTGAEITNGKATQIIKTIKFDKTVRFFDKKNLTQKDREYWKNGIIWYENSPHPSPLAAVVTEYIPEKNQINFQALKGKSDETFCRYYIEGLPQLLDHENEWCFVPRSNNAGRIYIRLKDDLDPNETIIEVAQKYIALDIHNKKNVVVKDLDFKFFNAASYRDKCKKFAPDYFNTVIRIYGNSKNISIENSSIKYASQGISVFPDQPGQVLENFTILSNDFEHIDNCAISISRTEVMWGSKICGLNLFPDGTFRSTIRRIKILHNNLYHIGFKEHHWNGIGAIGLRGATMLEIAYNKINYVAAQGINTLNGHFYNNEYIAYNVNHPLNRVLIHNNIISNACIAAQDYGGLESWHNGPVYIYNNISGNSVGMKYADRKQNPDKTDWYRTGCFAPAIYIDSAYKHYVFNNIMWGFNNNKRDDIYNAAGFVEATGFMNIVFNNTIYNCAVGFRKGMAAHNRCYYLNNLFIDIGEKFIFHQVQKNIEHSSLAYSENVFNSHVDKDSFSYLCKSNFADLSDMARYLEKENAMVADVGVYVDTPQVVDAKQHNFNLRKNSIGIDRAKKIFVPWGLYEVVGEWGFYLYPNDTTKIIDEHINWNKDWSTRSDVDEGCTPRHDLSAVHMSEKNFTYGLCENWIKGALIFNDDDQYLMLNNDQCGLFDMADNNFLLEVVLKTDSYGSIAGKMEESKTGTGKGYLLTVLNDGTPGLMIGFDNGNSILMKGTKPINDGRWHHIIAEADRINRKINIYIDGRPCNGEVKGEMESSSLKNEAPFLVAKYGNEHFKGEIDFLRVSRGTLADAETTIDELYNWQFDGPFLRDFYGNKPAGEARDVGAVECVD